MRKGFNVYVAKSGLRPIVVLAERADNPAASVTNAYERYAWAVCASMGIAREFEFYAGAGKLAGRRFPGSR